MMMMHDMSGGSDESQRERGQGTMFCLDCRYALEHLRSNECPECGRAFDPDDPATYRTTVVLKHPVRLAQAPMTEAVEMCGRLEEAGFAVSLHEERGGIIAYAEIPTGSVWVERDDEEKARSLMEQFAEAEQDRPPWTCASCGEEIDGDFEVCWNCGAEQGEGGSEDASDGV